MHPKPFSLDSVLSFRKRQESIAQEKFIQAKIAEDRALIELKTAQEGLAHLIEVLSEKQQQGILAIEQARFEERIRYSNNQIQLLEKNLKEKKRISQKRRQKLLEKAKEHKVLDTLKEQQNKIWQTYKNKKEAAMLDEIAVLRYAHHD